MRYMFLIYSDESTGAPYGTPEWQDLLSRYRAFGEEAGRRGVMVTGEPLESVHAATTLRPRDGQTVTLDGPFAETKEQLGGFYILDCRDRAEALELAEKIPSAHYGSVEVRPMVGHELRHIEPPRQKKYMLMFYGNEATYLPADDSRVKEGVAGHQRLTARLIEQGEFVTGDALALTRDAVTVRVRDGKTFHTDGPFAETKEQLGGFYVLNVRDLDRMLEIAVNFPLGPDGCIEIRPIQEM